MASSDFTFGHTPCAISTKADPAGSGEWAYTATVYVVEKSGRALRHVADQEGRRIEFVASTEEAAVQRASNYLADRFGERGPAPGWERGALRELVEPPLIDERPRRRS